MHYRGLLVACLLAGCLDTSAIVCEDGSVCPAGTVCHPTGCKYPSQLVDCMGHNNGDACSVAGDPGVCVDDVCQRSGCGDGLKSALEQCDTTDFGDVHDCRDLGYYDAGAVGCTDQCMYETSACMHRCGDGMLDTSSEECDGTALGAMTNCNELGFYDSKPLTCNKLCRYDVGACASAGYCGDGVQNGDEQCDGSSTGVATCADIGYYHAGTLSCDANCHYDITACDGICGDGDADTTDGEECDGADLNNASCTTLGFYAGAVTCLPNCHFDRSQCAGSCGDGSKNGTELCDGFDVGGAGCQAYGFYTGTLSCNATCDGIVTTGCDEHCGDGIKNGSEVCDGAALGGLACQAFGWNGGTLSCKADCSDVVQMDCSGFCGDGEITGTELCDSAEHAGEDCRTFGASGGPLGCNAFCQTTLEQCLWGRWRIEPRQTMNHVWDVVGVSPGEVWAIADRALLRHTDSGWTTLTTPGTGTMWAAWVNNTSDVWIAGSDAAGTKVFHGGGTLWTTTNPGLAGDLQDIWGSGPNDIWVVGTTGGSHWNGSAWTPVPALAGKSLSAIHGAAANDVWTVGLGVAMHWNGTAWTSPAGLPGSPSFDDVWTRNSVEAWAVSSDSLFHYVAGTGWTYQRLTSNMRAITGFTTNDAWIVGESVSLHYNGFEWANVPTGVSAQFYAVGGSPNDVFAGSFDGTLIHLDGLGFVNDNPAAIAHQLTVFGTSASDVWSAGQSGSIWYRNAQGWKAESTFQVATDWNAMWGMTPNDRVVVGVDHIGMFDAFVATPWTDRAFPGTWINDVTGTALDNIWAVARSGKVLHYTTDWSISTVSTEDLHGVFAISDTELWAVGDHGTALHYTGSWAPTSTFTGETLFAVWGSGSKDVWAVGNAIVKHWDGTVWSTIAVPTSATLYAVWGFAPDDLWIAGSGGALFHYDGATWASYEAGSADIHDLWGSSSADLYAAGNNGTVRHLGQPLPTIGGGACTAAIPLSCETTVLGGTTSADANDFASYACGTRPDSGGEAVYLLDTPMTGDVTITLTPNGVDLDLAMLSSCSASTCLRTSQTNGTGSESVMFTAVRAQPLYISVDGFGGASGPFTLDVSCAKN